MNDMRRLPFVIRPLPDEPFDSWVELMASSHGATITEMAAGLGLIGFDAQPDTQRRTSLRAWATELPAEDLHRLTEATGLPAEELRAMTRMDFAASAIRLTRSGRISSFCPSTGVAGRYCPDCLQDSGGRWRLSWQFPFGFVCLRHKAVLVDRCPNCEHPPRQTDHPAALVPLPGFCHNRLRDDRHKINRCGYDLRKHAGAPAATSGLLETQRQMLRVVATGRGSFGIYAEDPQPAIRVLEDMALLSRMARAATRADPSLGVAVLGSDLFSTYDEVAGRQTRRPELRPTEAVLVAVGNALAHWHLASPDRAAALLRGRLSANTPYSSHSVQLQALIAAALGRRRRPTAVMQTALPASSGLTSRAAKLPSVLWEPWVRALAPRRVNQEVAGGALAAMVVLAGTQLTHGAALSLLDPSTPGRQVTHVMRELGRTSTEANTITALTVLAEHLDQAVTPIDYHRRRHLDYTHLLPHDEWVSICADANVSPGGSKRWTLARLCAFAALSGSRVGTAPFAAPYYFSRQAVTEFHLAAPSGVLEAIERVCHRFLHHHGIAEPPTWCPPLEITPHVSPNPNDDDRHGRWPAARPGIARMSERIPLQQAVSTYSAGQSLRDVASIAGVARQTVGRALSTAGVPLRNPGRHPVPMDVEWLRHRYEDDRRTTREIAAEVGCHLSTISRHLERAGINARPRGSASRAAALRPDLRAGDNDLLRAVLIGQGAIQRATRFLVLAQHTTITAAANELGIADGVLSTQMRRLSQDAGGPLFTHSNGQRPLRLTLLGVRLAESIRGQLAVPESGQHGRADSNQATRRGDNAPGGLALHQRAESNDL